MPTFPATPGVVVDVECFAEDAAQELVVHENVAGEQIAVNPDERVRPRCCAQRAFPDLGKGYNIDKIVDLSEALPNRFIEHG